MPRSTTLARAGAALLGVLALVELVAGLSADAPSYGTVLLLVGCSLSSVSALAWHRRSGPESRLAAITSATLAGTGALLVALVGLPGRHPAGPGLNETGVLVLSVVVVLLAALDARSSARHRSAVPPYAL